MSPNLNFHSLFPTVDFIFGFFLFFLYLFLKEDKVIYAVILLSTIPYLKPVGLSLPIFVAIYFLIKKELKKTFIYFFIPYFSALLWAFFIYLRAGFFGFSSVIPTNLLTYYVPFAKAIKEKITYSEARKKMSDILMKELKPDYREKDLYYQMIKTSLREIKKYPLIFFLTHTIFSLNTLISPISFKPFIYYITGKEIKTPIQQEVFRLILKGKILNGIRKFFKERLSLLNLKGLFILVFAVFYNILLLVLFLKKLLTSRDTLLLLLILIPLIFSTGVLGEARFRCMFEILLIYFISIKFSIKEKSCFS